MRRTLLSLALIFTFVLPAKLYSQVNLNQGLIAYYQFNGDATDASGNGNNASFNNATLTTDRFGNANSAYYFNGIDNYIQIPNSASLNPTNAMSVALYFNPSQNGVQTLIGKIGYAAGVGTQFQVAMDFSLYPGVLFGVNPIANGCSNPPLNAAYVNTVSAITTNQWYCLVGTFDNGVMNIYLNGTLIQTSNAGFNTLNQCSNADIQIGSWWSGDLQRFMGKIDDVRIYNRALNLQEVNALCPLCTQPQGSLNGSTICTGAIGTLTFNYTTGTGPYTVQYSDGTNTFTQNNVTTGVPFAVANNPAATTAYTLTSLTDATGCSRTTGFVSAVTQIVVNNCAPASLCTGSLGDPVVNITFGSGNNPGKDLPTIVPGASTTLTYVPVSGNPANPTPLDGQYTVTNNVPYNADWFSGAANHTPNDPNGYMAFYNASEQPGEFYKQTVNNLCGSTTYEFAAWIANALDPSKAIGENPDITFRIEQTDGTLLASFDTGPIAQNSTFTWQQFGFYFTMPSNVSTVVLRMINNNPGGVANLGNDLAIDDITFRPCGPLITASFNAASIVDSISVCNGSNVKLYGTASSGYTNPGYLWQYSSDSGRTWTDIASSNSLQISVSAPTTNAVKNFKYRMLSGEGNNINSLNCRIISNLTILNVIPGPQGKLSAPNICPGNNANIIFTSASSPSPFSISWTDGTNTYSQTNLNNNSSFSTSFILTSTSSFKLHSVTDANGCTNNLDSPFTIIINPLPKGYLTGDDICVGDDGILLFTSTSGSPLFNISYLANGNAYTRTGVDNNSTFTVPFQLNNSTSFALTSISDANGCTAALDTSTSINVLPLPQGGLTDATVCTGDSAGITFNSTNGTGPFKVEISDGTNSTVYYDVQSGIAFNIAPVTQTTTISLISITDKDGDGCTRTNGFTSPTATITAKPSPEIQFDALTAICIQQSAFLITQAKEITGIAGNGIFSGDGVDINGNFNPSSAGVGTHKIAYTYNATNGCSAFDSSNITVNPTPVVSAGSDIITCLGFTVQLNATGASTYVWSPSIGLDNPASKNPIANIDSTTTYIVLGTDSNGCYASDTVKITVGASGVAVFAVPNAFTPNNDGVNDCFGIRRWGGVTVVEFDIFNRWGELIFSTKNPSDCWDGTFKGKLQPTGGYPYIIKAKTPCGDVTRKGIVILAR